MVERCGDIGMSPYVGLCVKDLLDLHAMEFHVHREQVIEAGSIERAEPWVGMETLRFEVGDFTNALGDKANGFLKPFVSSFVSVWIGLHISGTDLAER